MHTSAWFVSDDIYCPECNKSFKAMSSYRRHMRDYHVDSQQQVLKIWTAQTLFSILFQHQCDYCEKKFKTKGGMINHKSLVHRPATQHTVFMPQ